MIINYCNLQYHSLQIILKFQNMKSIAIVILLISLIFCKELAMIQETFRHGARFPLFFSKADHSDIAVTMQTPGQLTSQGKRMHYMLGKILYDKYWDQLFKGTPYEQKYGQTQFYVKSTDVNRTIQSAQSQLFGLLQRLPKLQLNRSSYEFSMPAWIGYEDNANISEVWAIFQNGPSFHPTPIHVQKRGANLCDSGDFLTKYDLQSCPNQKFWMAENLNSDSNIQIMRDSRMKEAIDALSNAIGTQVDFEEVYMWKDSYTSLKYLGYPKLQIFNDPKYANIFDFIEVYSMYLTLYSQTDQIRAVATDYFLQTLSNFEGKINKTYTPKMVLYSSHDTTIGMIFAAMNFVNVKCLIDHYLNGANNDDTCIWQYPPFSANIIFQLWNNNGEYTVKVLYKGEVKKIPICNYKTQCTFKQFKAWVQNFAVSNTSTACGLVGKNNVFYAVIFLLICAIAVFTVYICFLHAKIREIDTVGRAKRQGYIQNFQQKANEVELKQ